MTQRYDLDALEAAVAKAQALDGQGVTGAHHQAAYALMNAARSGLLDDARDGRAYRDAATVAWTRPEGGPTEDVLPPERVRKLVAIGLAVEAAAERDEAALWKDAEARAKRSGMNWALMNMSTGRAATSKLFWFRMVQEAKEEARAILALVEGR